MQSEIPEKLYFKIGEVSKLADVAPHVIRYWETEFDGIKPKRANSNQRLYRRDDVELILKIKELLHTRGYTIAGARKLLESGADIDELPPEITSISTTARLKKLKNEVLLLLKVLQKKE
jgi:DNA-binding transcriptional MerR regulator